MRLRTPEDRTLSPHTGWTRAHWEEVFRDLMAGCLKHATPAGSMIRFPGGRGSFYDPRADGFEGFSRMLWMAGPYLYHRASGETEIGGRAVDVAAVCRQGILAGTDPKSGDEYWGDIRTRHQTQVEAASVAVFLFLTRRHVWDRMSAAERDRVAGWLHQIIEKEPYKGNWALFHVLVNAALCALGRDYSRMEIDFYLDYMARFHVGNGWYTDGPGPCFEYYNAWAIHPYFYFWMMMDGDSRPDLLPVLRARTREFLDTYKYFFAANGVHVPFGRSLLYRMAAVSIFPVAELFGVSPLPPGQARRLCSGNLQYFVRNGAIRNHVMPMGFHGEYLPLPESYSSTQSPYWGAKAWWTLLLGPDHPFWTCREEPCEVEKRDYIVSIPAAGMLVQGRRASGQVTLYLNNSRDWAKKKYSNLVFSSHFGFDIQFADGTFNFDGGVCASEDGRHFLHRMYPVHLLTSDRFTSSYQMPFMDATGKERDPGTRIYTTTILKDDYHLRLHRVVANRNFQLFDGALALGYDRGRPAIRSGDGWEYASAGKKVSFIRNLHGFNGQVPARGFQGNPEGNNMMHRFSVVPALRYKGASIDGRLFASLVVHSLEGPTPAEINRRVTRFAVEDGVVHILFRDGEEMYVQVGETRDVFLKLRGRAIRGRVVFARVDPLGRFHVTYDDGRLLEY